MLRLCQQSWCLWDELCILTILGFYLCSKLLHIIMGMVFENCQCLMPNTLAENHCQRNHIPVTHISVSLWSSKEQETITNKRGGQSDEEMCSTKCEAVHPGEAAGNQTGIKRTKAHQVLETNVYFKLFQILCYNLLPFQFSLSSYNPKFQYNNFSRTFYGILFILNFLEEPLFFQITPFSPCQISISYGDRKKKQRNT